HGVNRVLISSCVLRRDCYLLSASPVFYRGICFTGAHCRGETVFVSSNRRQFRTVSTWSVGLLFLVATENDSLFLSRHRIARLGAHVDSAAILFIRDAVHDRLRPGFRIAVGGPRSGLVW